jgi:flavin-dependent dehydrogenase
MKEGLDMQTVDHYDVVIIGAGLAGLSLARQLLLDSGKTVLVLDKRSQIPPPHQKVGEATVQLSAYYLSKVLDLEEHLLREHFMKYNLRFYWKNATRDNRSFGDYSQAYIKTLSNIASYQLDRNKIEGEMLRLNLEDPRFDFRASVSDLNVRLSDDGPHSVSFRANGLKAALRADWVVDATGRGKFLARRQGLLKESPIRHGASWLWVEGLVNIEKLTDLSPKGIRLNKDRFAIGHLPFWLSTNHFCGEGFWLWVIPLQGKTSLGLVYDNRVISTKSVSTPQKLIEWVCKEFPLFARDLPYRKILDHSCFKDFSYDCAQTISKKRWAMSGEAGRFTDPLYSPGGDLISIHNSLITAAILTEDANELDYKCRLYEQLMKAVYEAYVPSYAASYDVLGDQEAMTMKYSWELAIYFSFYVFPFINDLFTDPSFVISFLGRFSRLGPINRGLQTFISSYYQWKKTARQPAHGPIFNDFTDIGPLRIAEKTFYSVGVSVDEARRILDFQFNNLREMARFIVAHISSVVLSDESALTNRRFIEGIDLVNLRFDPDEIRDRYAGCSASETSYDWVFDPCVLGKFITEPRRGFAESATMYAGKGGAQCGTTPL